MKDLPGNQSYEEAERFINEASERNNFPDAERAIIAKNGLTLATLALAYEQRTANLIALATMNPEWYGSTSREAFEQIDARLGITKGAAE